MSVNQSPNSNRNDDMFPVPGGTRNLPSILSPQERGEMQDTSGYAMAVEKPFSLTDMIDVIFRRGWWMLIAFTVVFVLGMFWTFTQKPKYTSTTALQVSSTKGSGSMEADLPILQDLQSLTGRTSIGTQLYILQNSDLQSKVLANILPKLKAEKLEVGDPQFVIKNTKDTDIISIDVTALNPQAAAAIANGLAAEYMQQNKDQNQENTLKAAKFIEDEKIRVGQVLNTARRRVAAFKSEKKIVDIEQTLTTRATELGTLEAAVNQAKRDYSEATKLTSELGKLLSKTDKKVIASLTTTPNPAIADFDKKIEDLEAKRAELTVQYNPGARELTDIENLINAAQKRRADAVKTQIAGQTDTPNPVYSDLSLQYMTTQAHARASQVRVGALQNELSVLHDQLAALPSEELRFTELMSSVKEYETTYALLSEKYQELSIALQGRLGDARVVKVAKAEKSPVSPKIMRNAILFAMLGLILAVCLAMALESLDDRVYSDDMIERLSTRPVLAYMPISADSPRLIDHPERHSSILESIRLLRSNLTFASMDTPMRSLLFTSAGASEGKSSMAINLAIALAMDSKRVIIIDADLRRPSMHSYFGLSRDKGLTNVAVGTLSLQEAIQQTATEGVFLLASGPLPPNPPEVLNSLGVRKVIQELTELYDMVIIDAPPTAGLSDASVISTCVDGVLMIVSAAQTHRGQLRIALRTLEQVGAPLLGFIFNKIMPTRRGYGSYYYYYYYSYYYYEQDAEGQKKRKKRSRRHHKSESAKALPGPQEQSASSEK